MPSPADPSMTHRGCRALVSGASVAGLSAAYWLQQIGWQVELVERAPAFRDGGQNVDVRGIAKDVVDRMGLTETIRELTTTEQGTRFVDADGGTVGEFPAQDGVDGPTAELEILRGDLAGAVRDRLREGTPIRYGETIADAAPDGQVELAGRRDTYDLVVIAEGVRSGTRDAVWGDAVQTEPLDLMMVYGTIPRTDDDDRWWRWYTADQQRQVTLRPDRVGTIRATLAYRTTEDDLTRADVAERSERLREVFGDAGWQAERVLDGFERSDDVYVDFLEQVKASAWSRGRLVLTGDAAWCVTPLGGGGSSLALVGGYVLAAYLSQTPDDVDGALARYEQWLRPVVEATQELPPGTPRLAYPKTTFGVRLLQTGIRVASSGPVRAAAGRLMGGAAETDQVLPELVRPDTSDR